MAKIKCLFFSTHFVCNAYICAVIIIDKDKRTPKFIWRPHPKESEFRNTLDKRKYVENEVTKWNEGANGLTGFQYFYLQEWILKDNVTDMPIHPLWREDDEDIVFKPLDFCSDKMYDYMLFKRREAAWSSILSARIAWRGLTRLGAELLYTSADRNRIMGFFEFKLKYGFEKMMLPLRLLGINTIEETGYKRMMTKYTNTKAASKMSFLDPLSPHEGETVIYGIDTEPPNTRALEGYRSPEIYIDEIGLKSDLSGLLGSANSSRQRGLVRSGIILAGGTCADMKPDTAKGLRDMMVNNESLKIITQFYLGYHGIFEIPHPTEDGINVKITHNGYTDHKLAIETIEKRRESLWKLTDKTLYWEFFKAYPLSADEIFEGNDISILPEDIKERLHKQHFVIVKNEPPMFGRMHLINNEPVFKEEERGPIVVLNPPTTNIPYVAGTDPIPFSSNKLHIGSEYATAIKNRITKSYEAYHAERHNDPHTIVMQSILLQIWYNKAKTLLEMDQGAVAYNKYLELGYKDLLAHRPNFQGIKYVNGDVPYGYRASLLGATGNGMLLTYARENCEQIFLQRMYEEYLRFGTSANLDLLDAIRGAEILDAFLFQKEKKDEDKNKTTEHKVLSVVGGKRVWVSIKVNNNYLNGEISHDQIHRQ